MDQVDIERRVNKGVALVKKQTKSTTASVEAMQLYGSICFLARRGKEAEGVQMKRGRE